MTEKNDFKMQKVEEEVAKKQKELEASKIIVSYLRRLGMPAHLRGYRYVREAITMKVLNPDKDYSITKELYPEVGKKNNTSGVRVEKAIRSAIGVAWQRGDMEFINEVFGNTVSYERAKPTNSEFINQIAEDIRIKNLI